METFLTKRQMQVFELEKRGIGISEMAERLGTSIQNISMLRRKAHEKIERAYATVEFAEAIETGPNLVARMRKGTEISSIPAKIFRIADSGNVKVRVRSWEIIKMLEEKNKVRKGKLISKASITVMPDGSVMVG